MHNYNTHVFTSESRGMSSHGCSTRGITQDVSTGKHGPHKHVMRLVLSVSCYHKFPRVKNEVIIEWYCMYINTITRHIILLTMNNIYIVTQLAIFVLK